ncbi:MAG: hypothetical protein Q4A40_07275 [Bacillota bacterium]|nr:hypothetical protein [Bacillota bacterium]
MRNKNLIVLLAAVCWCIMMTGCHAASKFDGNKTVNDGYFQMGYSILNQSEDATLSLEAGDTLQVEILQSSGTVSVSVGIDGKEPIYTGADLANADFALNIQETGSYRISVTGNNARGSVAFTRNAANSEVTEYSTEDQAATYEAYQFALQQIAFEHIYPDGTDTGFDGALGFIEDNHFALYDINSDDVDELIVQFVTAPMAGNAENIYSNDSETGTLVKLLSVFPALTYYDNGIVKEKWSHGSALAGDDYWPYNLYRYNTQTRQYDQIAEVNMWSKAVDIVDFKGDPYPEDIDAENAGTVFILTRNGITETVCKSDYEAWLSDLIGNADELQIPYQYLSEANIKAICE